MRRAPTLGKAAGLLALLLSASMTAHAGPQAPSPAPPLVGRTTAGDSVRLADFRGHVVLVDFWATWCPPCRKQLPHLAELEAREPELVVLTVCVDARPAAVPRFLRRVAHPRRVLLDPEGRLAERYAVAAMPWSVLVDRDGRIVRTAAGLLDDSGREFMAALEALLHGGAP